MLAERSEDKHDQEVGGETRDTIGIELDGEGIHPDTAPAHALLDIASAYFGLIAKDAWVVGGRELALTGVRILDKCALVQTLPSDIEVATASMRRAVKYVAGREAAPHGTAGLVATLKATLESWPAIDVHVHAGGEKLRLVSARMDTLRQSAELGTWRAIVRKVGGTDPRVHFYASGIGAFALPVSKVLAEELAAHLYKEMDLTARIEWTPAGRVGGGEVLHYMVIEDLSAEAQIAATRSWFQRNGSRWIDSDEP